MRSEFSTEGFRYPLFFFLRPWGLGPGQNGKDPLDKNLEHDTETGMMSGCRVKDLYETPVMATIAIARDYSNSSHRSGSTVPSTQQHPPIMSNMHPRC